MTLQFLPQLKQPLAEEQRFVQIGLSWQQFQTLQAAFEDIPGVRLYYFDGVLELMTIGKTHEIVKSSIGSLLELYFLEKGIDFTPTGSMTMKGDNPGRWLEADESYSIGEEKDYPDIAIEVVVTSGGANKLLGYQHFGIREVWLWEEKQFALYRLKDGNYNQIDCSEFLPELDL
ncbi:Uma2 family endonuclease [Lusitaniella coriacea]